MITKDYQEALVEVLAIVDTDQNFKAKIPKKLLQFFKENASSDYQINFDTNLRLKDMPLKKETKGLISMLYRNYFCVSDEKKQEFDDKLRDNDIAYEEMLKEKYNPENIFKPIAFAETSNTIPKEADIVLYKENIFTKLINKIKSFFSRKKD